MRAGSRCSPRFLKNENLGFPGVKLNLFSRGAVSMSAAAFRLSLLAVCFCATQGLAQPPTTQLNPTVKKIVEEVSEERIGAIMKKLGDFGTRYVGSETEHT